MSDEPVLRAYLVQSNDGRQDNASVIEAANEDCLIGSLRILGKPIFSYYRIPCAQCAEPRKCIGKIFCPRKGDLHCQQHRK